MFNSRFVWDEAKYPTMSPLREIVDGIHVQVAKIEDDLKVRILICSFNVAFIINRFISPYYILLWTLRLESTMLLLQACYSVVIS